MISTNHLFVILFILAFAAGFLVALKLKRYRLRSASSNKFLNNYYEGLNYLIDEKPDNAIDVFVNLLQVDSNTVDLHLSLGNLFRRQGEHERAIRIHQNLIARPQLSKEYKAQALAALAQDYYQAGVYDRAERLFAELIANKAHVLESARFLLNIYQQEKEWAKAIQMAKKIQSISTVDLKKALAHYHCELAENAQGDIKAAKALLKKAGYIDGNCVRVSLLEARLAGKNYYAAIKCYRKIAKQNPSFINEVLPAVVECYRNLNDNDGLLALLNEFTMLKPTAKLAWTIAKSLSQTAGVHKAVDYLQERLNFIPAEQSLLYFSECAANASHGEARQRFDAVRRVLCELNKQHPSYQCGECGYAGQLFYWLCPSCQQWETVMPL